MKKICIGLQNISSRFQDLKKGLQALGYEVTTVALQDNNPLVGGRQYDHIIAPFLRGPLTKVWGPGITKKVNEALKLAGHCFNRKVYSLAQQCDAFIFIWYSFSCTFDDYQYLKSLGKTVIVIFVGDDVRWQPAMQQDFALHGLDPVVYPPSWYYNTLRGLRIRLQRLRKAEKYADVIFSRREQAQLQIRPYYQMPSTHVDLDLFPVAGEQRKDKPVVVHAPTSPEIKGTRHVLQAFGSLQNEGLSFEPVLLQNIPYATFMQKIQQADIVVDQLLLPGGGKLSSEALASGKVLLTRMAYDTYRQGAYYDACPAVEVHPHNIVEKLRHIILDYPQRQQLASQARPYAEQFLNIRIFCKQLADIIEGQQPSGAELQYPDFFQKYFKPESEKARRLYERLTG